MLYEVTPLPFKPHRLVGLSERLLVSHYENNYGGAVRRLNTIEQRLAGLGWAATPGFEMNGLGRERLIAANSMLLHEAYFDGLGGSGEPSGGIAGALERDFGSVDRWRAEFSAMGKALAGGSGWVLLTWSDRLGRLTNQWAADHCHTLAGGSLILALDMYEHAYALDFGAKAAAYVDAFMGNIHWERIDARYGQALAAQRAIQGRCLTGRADAQEPAAHPHVRRPRQACRYNAQTDRCGWAHAHPGALRGKSDPIRSPEADFQGSCRRSFGRVALLPREPPIYRPNLPGCSSSQF
jgi:superoxide dismutase